MKNFEENAFDEFDGFLVRLAGRLPKAVLLEPEQVSRVEGAQLGLDEFLARSGQSAVTKLHWMPALLMASVTVDLDDLVVRDTENFHQAVKAADNFEIYPLENGKIRLALAFQNVFTVFQ